MAAWCLRPCRSTGGSGPGGGGPDYSKKRDAVAISGDVLAKGDLAALSKGDRADVLRPKSAVADFLRFSSLSCAPTARPIRF
jgi:hypothetical protein